MSNRNFSKLKIVLTVSYMLFILATSLIPMEHSDSQPSPFSVLSPKIQNLLHIPMFGLLSILLVNIFGDHTNKKPKALLLVLVICVVFGILNELIQFFIPGRYGGLLDIALDIVGTLAGLGCYHLYRQRLRKRHNNKMRSLLNFLTLFNAIKCQIL